MDTHAMTHRVASSPQTDPLGFGAIHHLAEDDFGEGGLRTDDAPQHPGVPAARVDAELQEAAAVPEEPEEGEQAPAPSGVDVMGEGELRQKRGGHARGGGQDAEEDEEAHKARAFREAREIAAVPKEHATDRKSVV